MSYYAKNPHYSPTDLSEDVERLDRAEIQADQWFADATKAQRAIFNGTMARIAAYKDTDAWAIESIKAHDVWNETTAGAQAIRQMVIADMMLSGEVSTATAEAYDALLIGATS